MLLNNKNNMSSNPNELSLDPIYTSLIFPKVFNSNFNKPVKTNNNVMTLINHEAINKKIIEIENLLSSNPKYELHTINSSRSSKTNLNDSMEILPNQTEKLSPSNTFSSINRI